MKIVVHENGPFMVNSYLVINESNNKGIMIDPGADIGFLIKKIQDEAIILDAIVCTHGHIDHIGGVSILKEKFNALIYINEFEEDIVSSAPLQARMFGVPNPGVISIDRNLPSSGMIELAGLQFALFHTPGHSPGSISLLHNDMLFSGDTLFNMSIGRTDLPGGDYEKIITSIQKHLFTLPEETRVLCGHGPETSIGIEKRFNPFLK
jgi:glyoxylase-like metal-dependent hydrolase (beta-lactamase superfamily II)